MPESKLAPIRLTPARAAMIAKVSEISGETGITAIVDHLLRFYLVQHNTPRPSPGQGGSDDEDRSSRANH